MVVYQAYIWHRPPIGPSGIYQATLKALYGRLPGVCILPAADRSETSMLGAVDLCDDENMMTSPTLGIKRLLVK